MWIADQLESQRNLHLSLLYSWFCDGLLAVFHRFFLWNWFCFPLIFKLVLRSFLGLVEFENVSYFQHSMLLTKSESQQAFVIVMINFPHSAPRIKCKVCVISKDLLSKLNYKEQINIKFAWEDSCMILRSTRLYHCWPSWCFKETYICYYFTNSFVMGCLQFFSECVFPYDFVSYDLFYLWSLFAD